ncbi:MAG TPA: hypothetical protein VGR10_03480 [Thermoleophilaceae bacterium]|nr:hypothetical protein [Thermoleophilaceae bacterium]
MDLVNVAFFVLAVAITVLPAPAMVWLGLRDLRKEARGTAEPEDE